MEDHLAKTNGIKLDGLNYRLGKQLTFNADSETTGDAKADEILRGTYRKGFELPAGAV
jgi:hypothetical protein